MSILKGYEEYWMRVAKIGKRLFLPKKREFFYANNWRKCHSIEELRMWIKVADYKRSEIGVVKGWI